MPNHSGDHRSGKTMRCAVCDGKFGLVRYSSWGTQLCSRKCVDRFRICRANDGNWLPRLQITFSRLCQRSAQRLGDV